MNDNKKMNERQLSISAVFLPQNTKPLVTETNRFGIVSLSLETEGFETRHTTAATAQTVLTTTR
jgi:hypothetical protein